MIDPRSGREPALLALRDAEAERIRGGGANAFDGAFWLRSIKQAQQDAQSFWSLFQILARSAFRSLTGD